MALMSRILVTGACGFVGPSVVNLGLRLGHEIFATDLTPLYQKYLDSSAKLKLGVDITNPSQIAQYIEEVRPDIILHVAAYFRYYGPWKMFEAINIEGTRNVLEGALKIPSLKRVVVWSSGSVLGYSFKGLRILDEKEPARPRSFYEKSKLLAEEAALKYANRLPIVIMRPAAIYGSGIEFGGPAGTYAALKVIQMMFKNQLHAIPGWGRNQITFIHVEDIARVAFFLAEEKEAVGETYNVADLSRHPLSDLLIYIAEWIRKHDIPLNFSSKLHFPNSVIYLLGLWCELLAKVQKREPAVERPFLNFFRKNYHFLLSNEKLDRLIKKTEGKRHPLLGPVIKYKDIIHDGAMDHNLEWYRRKLLCS